MNLSFSRESFDSLDYLWAEPGSNLNWSSVFILPPWLRVWWQEFKPDAEPYLLAVRRDESVIGIAPLIILNGKASFIGSTNVCDYVDFIITPGMEFQFFNTLLDDLKNTGITELDLGHLRPDSTVLTYLLEIAREGGYEIDTRQEDISIEMDLPSTWDEYLNRLDKKQRHEIRRKLRRLEEADRDYRYYEIDYNDEGILSDFIKLFSLSRGEKASFMTNDMESFFRALIDAMSKTGLLRFGILELEGQPAAIVMGFDYNGTMYLYNSAYDPKYNHLSAGLLSKVFCIKESIQEGRKIFNFLKGNEQYKYYLGGHEIPIYSCQITIK
jgi:CelD/BcsL family acetyltransferase involved in cellulose biosynthesis